MVKDRLEVAQAGMLERTELQDIRRRYRRMNGSTTVPTALYSTYI